MLSDLHPDEALALVLECARRAFPSPETESAPLGAALGRVMPAPVRSPIDHPPFDKSAMDGFAFARSGGGDLFAVVAEIPAGLHSAASLGAGEAIRIMTGAPVPPGTDAVQRIEWTSPAGTDGNGRPLVRFDRSEGSDNIIRKGENLKRGEALLSPRVLKAQDIGILAAAGIPEARVARKLRVAVVSTGDEIEEAGAPLPQASIYDSNGPQLCAQAAEAGAEVRFFGIARDGREELSAVFSRALDGSDVVLVSGGVSLGDFDLVPDTLEALGVGGVFHSLRMKPGKPTYFGMRGRTAVFGLPGNPVSTFVNFHVFVLPYLRMISGLEHKPARIPARLARPLKRKGADRVEFLPLALCAEEEGMSAAPLFYRGSSMVTVLAEADALARMEIGQAEIPEGTVIDARLIRP